MDQGHHSWYLATLLLKVRVLVSAQVLLDFVLRLDNIYTVNVLGCRLLLLIKNRIFHDARQAVEFNIQHIYANDPSSKCLEERLKSCV